MGSNPSSWKNARWIEAFGERLTLTEWSRALGIPYPTLRGSLDRDEDLAPEATLYALALKNFKRLTPWMREVLRAEDLRRKAVQGARICVCRCRFDDHAHKAPHACTACRGHGRIVCSAFTLPRWPVRRPVVEPVSPWRNARVGATHETREDQGQRVNGRAG